MALTLASGITASTFAQLRSCGQGRNECVVYWTGPRSVPGAVDGVIQPVHQAGPDWYEIEPAWITSFFLELRRTGRTARAQVHSHPKLAWHSCTDDRYPLAPSPGFYSLVLPRFAAGPFGLDDAYLAEFGADGAWLERSPDTEIREAG
jgi:hypothetical protein